RGLVIEVSRRFGIAVGDEDVLVPIIVEVAKQLTPAPVGVGNPCQGTDFAEDDITGLRDAVTQLQRVDVVIVAKSPATQLYLTAVGEVPAHALALGQGGRHHVHLQNVGPAVVIEIGDVHAHAREARVLEPRTSPVGERSISVVDVEDIIGGDVVGDVEIGPPVPVQVGNRDP